VFPQQPKNNFEAKPQLRNKNNQPKHARLIGNTEKAREIEPVSIGMAGWSSSP
jgi:hypothetical protein